jgi:hypothetical protein
MESKARENNIEIERALDPLLGKVYLAKILKRILG